MPCGSERVEPTPYSEFKFLQRKKQKDHLKDGLSACLPGDDLLSQNPAVQVSSALEVLTSVFEIRKGIVYPFAGALFG